MSDEVFTLTQKLQGFVRTWRGWNGREQAGSQSFLNGLLNIYEAPFKLGEIFEQHPISVKKTVPAKRRRGSQSSLFDEVETVYTRERMDMYLPRICVWEMKSPSENLQDHHAQVLGYWALTRPRYMVLCNFREFWIYDTEEENGQLTPKTCFTLEELPEFSDALLFLKGEESHFRRRAERVTMQMAGRLGTLVQEVTRAANNSDRVREEITSFTLQCVFAMFAEDGDLFPKGLLSNALDEAVKTVSMAPIRRLFNDLSQEDLSLKVNKVVPYADGSLYEDRHPTLQLTQEWLSILQSAAKDFDWREVRPEIFGSIFEQALDPASRHELGAHFTREEDILKVVTPTVLTPWRQRIVTARTPKDVLRVIESMQKFHVLDPACGCGNFLYVVYREMKRLERTLEERWKWVHIQKGVSRMRVPRPPLGPYFSLNQLHGIEINSFAAQLARTVLWIGEYMAKQELDLDEETLPLKRLDEVILCEDALHIGWPRPEGELAIVGNPPYLGVRKMRTELGDAYVDQLFEMFPENRAADYVTYWFPKALGILRTGERAGFVTTNSIAQNESREASIDKILDGGGTLTDVWKSYPWPGEAAVHVSIVNWIMEKYEGIRMLDGQEVSAISPRFTDAIDVTRARPIPENQGLSFMGVTPGNREFILSNEEKDELISADRLSKKTIKPFLVGKDLSREIDQQPTRWIIDFGLMDLEEAEKYKAAIRHVRKYVYPVRKNNRRKAYAERWWRFVEPRPGMRMALADTTRFLGIPEVSPHLQFTFVETGIIPDHQVIVLVLSSSYHFGILQSKIHEYWALHKSSTLGEGLRYTPTTIFETFPFPRLPDRKYDPKKIPDIRAAKQVIKQATALYDRRKELCGELNLGLTKIYNLMKNGDLPELQKLHDDLNEAVNECYGWPEGTWRDENEVLKRLLVMNKELTHW